jgi:OOP family OmpA-OmpF porin
MSNHVLKLSVSVLVTLALPGCAAYSNLVNSLGPDKQQSELRQLVEAPLELTEGSSPFCAVPSEIYMVMPEDGKVGTVVVTLLDGREEVLQGDYSGMTLAGQQTATFTGDEQQVQELFGAALSALPPQPYHAKLYFKLDKDELTAESSIKAQQVFDEIMSREIAEIIIVGHTDTAASFAYNDQLSKRRAEKVRQSLVDAGVPPDIIKTRGAGEYELLVDTPDSTPEPQNRRVEIDVR